MVCAQFAYEKMTEEEKKEKKDKIFKEVISKGCRFATEDEIWAVKDAVQKSIVEGKKYEDFEIMPYYGIKVFKDKSKTECCEIRMITFDDCAGECPCDISERFHCEAKKVICGFIINDEFIVDDENIFNKIQQNTTYPNIYYI